MSFIFSPSTPQVSLLRHIMENSSSIKYMPKRRVLTIYGCCITLFSFCAFYAYSVKRPFSSRPLDDSVLETPTSDKSPVDQEMSLSQRVNYAEQHKHTENRKILRIFKKFSDNTSHVRDSKDNYSILTAKDDLQSSTSYSPDTYSSQFHAVKTSDRAELINVSTCAISRPKLILLWTPFFDIWGYLTTSSFSRCKGCSNNCIVTSNRSMLLQSDAVIFHVRDMSIADLPARRLPHQIWIFYCLESPPYSDFPGFQFMHNMFNWTMTYRLDSDVVSDYGSVKQVEKDQPLDRKSLEEKWWKKSGSVVWMSSHCPTHGGRDDYVEELKKYIDVDEFGTCGQQVCPKDSTKQCLERFATTYKFFLAFENSICKDYVTEKFFRMLSYDIIPVVFGGASYSKVAPPGSYIDALSFKSPEHLANFLKGVSNSFSIYQTYFKWRKNYTVRLDSDRDCILCSMLHSKNLTSKSYDDMRKWWILEGQCKVWKLI